LKSCCILQDYYDNERNRPYVFHNTNLISDLQDQDQDHIVRKTKTKKDRFFGLRLVLRPTVSARPHHWSDH